MRVTDSYAGESERVTFPGSQGDQLVGRLERPAGPVRAWALFAHCFTCSKDLKAVRHISRRLAADGFAVFRFDFTGLGESEGDFEDTDFSSNLDDLVAAADHMRSEFAAPRLLIGHSLGGAAVLVAAERIPECGAVAMIGAPSETEHLRERLLLKAPELEEGETADVQLGGRQFTIRRELLDDLARDRVLGAASELSRPLILFHSPVDEVVPIEHARRLFEAAHHPKSFVSLDRADHLLLNDPEDAHFVADVLAAWAARYVDCDESEGDQVPSAAKSEVPRGVLVAHGGGEGFRVRMQAGPHVLISDEPPSHGGGDAGADPYDYLLAGLAACKVMTMRMYADRKGWALKGSRVELRHEKIHAKDCEDCETEDTMLDEIRVGVSLDGPLTGDQRQRIFEISERCPVHRTLTSEVKIRSEMLRA